jgi:hypothetical protein
MSTDVPARLTGWIECRKCGRFDTPTRDLRLPKDEGSPTLEKFGIVRGRCRQYAALYLLRTAFSIH